MKVDLLPLVQGYKDLDECLNRLKEKRESFGGREDVKRLERMLEMGLDVLHNRITELQKLGYEDPMKHRMFKR